MELLKKITLTLLVNILFCQVSISQDFARLKDAFQKSYTQEAAKEYPAAISSIKAVYDEKSYELNLRLGWLYYLSANYNESRIYYNRAISIFPYSVEAKLGLTYPLAALGNLNEVISQYEKILEITPNYSVVLYKLGMIYYEKGDYSSALRFFEKVVNLWPFDYDSITMLGWTHFRLNNIREAKVLFQKALLNSPDGTSALQGLELVN
ncbi:MAG TPA: DUF2225 domain-containing protein [Bacteroidales bacterium]|nr:DUF2225 domain-containing protein [Bacteroidales bacterium]